MNNSKVEKMTSNHKFILKNLESLKKKKKTSMCRKNKKKEKFEKTEYSSPPPHSLGSWSASTSPARSPPSPRSRYPGGSATHRNNRRNHLNYKAYGTTSLMQRSRSPSPARIQEMRERDRYYRNEMGTLENSKYQKEFFFLLFSFIFIL